MIYIRRQTGHVISNENSNFENEHLKTCMNDTKWQDITRVCIPDSFFFLFCFVLNKCEDRVSLTLNNLPVGEDDYELLTSAGHVNPWPIPRCAGGTELGILELA